MKHTIHARIKKTALERHCLIVGATGSGKSQLMQGMVWDLIRTSNAKRQHAVVLVETHGDFSSKIAFAKHIPLDRLVYVSATMNREAGVQGYMCSVNPFENDGSDEMRYVLTTELTAAITELLADTSTPLTVQMTMLLRNMISVTLRAKEIGVNPSLEVLCRFCLDKDGQNTDLVELGKRSPNPRERTFFTHDFHSQDYNITKRSIRTKLLYFISDELLYDMLCRPSTANIENSLTKGDVIIFQIPKGASKFVSSVFGRLMIAYLNSLMLRREALPMKERKQCYCFIDEFQTLITQSLASSLQEIRKYRMSLILATQSLKQIESTTLKKTVMVNSGLRCISLSDNQDRKEFSAEMGVKTEELEKLQAMQFMIKNNDGKSQAFRFRVHILKNELFYQGKEKQAVLDYLLHQSGIYRQLPKTENTDETTGTKSPPPPPAPPLATPPEQPKSKEKKTRPADDNPFSGTRPSFTPKAE